MRCSRLRLGRVGRVVRAVVEPRVDVERHVDDVEADVGAVGQRVDDRLQEQEAAVLAAADLHQRDVRRDAGDADAVERGPDVPETCVPWPESSQPTGSMHAANSHGPSMLGDVGDEVAGLGRRRSSARGQGCGRRGPSRGSPTVTPFAPAWTAARAVRSGPCAAPTACCPAGPCRRWRRRCRLSRPVPRSVARASVSTSSLTTVASGCLADDLRPRAAPTTASWCAIARTNPSRGARHGQQPTSVVPAERPCRRRP